MEMDNIYTGLQKPSEDVYSTINNPQGRTAGVQQGVSPVQPSSCSSVTIALGVTVCVLLVAVIGMGIAILQIQGTHCVPGNSSTASQTSTDSYMKNSSGLVRSFCWDQDNGDEADLCEICPRTWRWKYNGSCYDFSLIPQSWVSSSNACSKDGGHLVVIDDQQELHFLRSKMVGGTFYWIGLKGKLSLEEWRWVDNTTFNATLFPFNNTDHRGRDCVIISNTKKYSEPCETGRPRICERKALRLSPNP
ncbi:C-type lectin domain family 1 member A-like [Acipenser ruthenus]|uniref:C-type lectin domain family 1 member A-like n=1 Tax=Acipenser ruthenus TaxID=7906 RepID=UPI0027410880|nr:C-type lectin domain family 1 member A-like [Acipenser ruthenus]